MTPFSSVAMLEKLALLKIAFCKAPVLSRAASRRTSVTASALPASPSRKAESWICSDMAASVQIVKLKNSITPRTSPPRRIGKYIGNSNAIFPMTTVLAYLLSTPVKLKLCELYLFDQGVVNQFSLAFIPIYLVSILPIYLHGTATPSRIKLNDATLKTRAICWMENSVQSWHRCLVFCHHLITLSALYSMDCGIFRPICFAVFWF